MTSIDQLSPALRPTPGPWWATDQAVYGPDRQFIAKVAIGSGKDANGRLIAAAPELLEAIPPLIGLIHRLLPVHAQADSTLDNLPEILQARAAIAKSLPPYLNQPERSQP
jgi:hypothetical protein